MPIINSPSISSKIIDEQFQRSSQIRNNIYSHFPANCMIWGLGGIGSNVAMLLSSIRSVENIVLLDDDIIEHHNLPRTVYAYRHEGVYKVQAMAEIISSHNVGPNVYPINARFNQEMCERINTDDELDFIKYTDFMIFDCRDDFFADYNLLETIQERDTQFKIVRAAYNEMSITIDLNPRIHPVWGTGGYNENTASHSIPSKLSALLVVMLAAQYDKYMGTPLSRVPINFNANDAIELILNGVTIDKLAQADKENIMKKIDAKLKEHNVDNQDTTISDDTSETDTSPQDGE